jgi:hypothetical protein
MTRLCVIAALVNVQRAVLVAIAPLRQASR